MEFAQILQQHLEPHHIREKVERVVKRVYWSLRDAGYNTCILNDRYLVVDGKSYQLRRNRQINSWTAKEF